MHITFYPYTTPVDIVTICLSVFLVFFTLHPLSITHQQQRTKQGTSELAAIMERRKYRADSDDSNGYDNAVTLPPPDFNPTPPEAGGT